MTEFRLERQYLLSGHCSQTALILPPSDSLKNLPKWLMCALSRAGIFDLEQETNYGGNSLDKVIERGCTDYS
jgi:hypothetical protein